MNLFFLQTAATGSTTGSMVSMIATFALIILVMYLFMIRPQKKKEKKLDDMRNSLECGDTITTIGGITGIVFSLKDDTVVVETGTDRTKIRFKRWAIQDVQKLEVETK